MKINPNTDYSALFSSLNTKDSNTAFLSDYASIKNGSYGKLMKAYYNQKKADVSDAKATLKTDNKAKTNKTSTKNKEKTEKVKEVDKKTSALSNAKTSAENFKSSLSNFEKAVAKGDDKEIASKAKAFADSYNKLATAVNEAGNTKVTKAAQNLLDYMGSNLNTLSKAGFSFDETGKLSVSEKAVSENKSSVETLFGKQSSFASNLESKAATVESRANSALNTEKSYTKKADYNNTDYIGKLYDGFM